MEVRGVPGVGGLHSRVRVGLHSQGVQSGYRGVGVKYKGVVHNG